MASTKATCLHIVDTLKEAILFYKDNFINLFFINGVAVFIMACSRILGYFIPTFAFPILLIALYFSLRVIVMLVVYIMRVREKGKYKFNFKESYKEAGKQATTFLFMFIGMGLLVLACGFTFTSTKLNFRLGYNFPSWYFIKSNIISMIFVYGYTRFIFAPFLSILYFKETGFFKRSVRLTKKRTLFVFILVALPTIPYLVNVMWEFTKYYFNVNILNYSVSIFLGPLWVCTVMFMLKKLEKHPGKKLREIPTGVRELNPES